MNSTEFYQDQETQERLLNENVKANDIMTLIAQTLKENGYIPEDRPFLFNTDSPNNQLPIQVLNENGEWRTRFTITINE